MDAAEHAARDRNIAHANMVVADLIGHARVQLRQGGDPADAFVQVGLLCADAVTKCKPGHEVAFAIALLTAASLATARHMDRSHE